MINAIRSKLKGYHARGSQTMGSMRKAFGEKVSSAADTVARAAVRSELFNDSPAEHYVRSQADAAVKARKKAAMEILTRLRAARTAYMERRNAMHAPVIDAYRSYLNRSKNSGHKPEYWSMAQLTRRKILPFYQSGKAATRMAGAVWPTPEAQKTVSSVRQALHSAIRMRAQANAHADQAKSERMKEEFWNFLKTGETMVHGHWRKAAIGLGVVAGGYAAYKGAQYVKAYVRGRKLKADLPKTPYSPLKPRKLKARVAVPVKENGETSFGQLTRGSAVAPKNVVRAVRIRRAKLGQAR